MQKIVKKIKYRNF